MRINIPTIGVKIKLEKSWEFTLHSEYRNDSLFGYAGFPIPTRWYTWMKDDPARFGPEPLPIRYTLPVNTILTIDRIYIRKGAAEFDSISFILNGARYNKRPVRFWAKLEDVNRIEGEYIPKETT
jgi:hypothetical protein